jgi:hypothetical protein
VKDNPMAPSTFDLIHSLSLCIEVEITTTQYFVQNEIEFRSVLDDQPLVDSLTEFQTQYKESIVDPFYKFFFNPIVNDLDNHDEMDYFFAYAHIDFFEKAHAFNQQLLKLTADKYLLSLIHSDIDDSYPGIKHNPKLYPYIETLLFLKDYATGK